MWANTFLSPYLHPISCALSGKTLHQCRVCIGSYTLSSRRGLCMGCRIVKGVSERCIVRLLLTIWSRSSLHAFCCISELLDGFELGGLYMLECHTYIFCCTKSPLEFTCHLHYVLFGIQQPFMAACYVTLFTLRSVRPVAVSFSKQVVCFQSGGISSTNSDYKFCMTFYGS